MKALDKAIKVCDIKYSKEDKLENWRKYSKELLRMAERSSLKEISEKGAEIDRLYREGGLTKSDYDNLIKKVALGQRMSKSRNQYE